MGTLLVGTIVIIIVAAIIRSMIKDKKAGKSIQCGVGCEHVLQLQKRLGSRYNKPRAQPFFDYRRK